MWPHRRRIQTMFQDPYSSMNPRLPSAPSSASPWRISASPKARIAMSEWRSSSAVSACGRRRCVNSPHEFSGGQRQRLGIAKALSVNPDVIVADEPVSALDVSVQAQVLNLLIDLQEEYGLAYLFISHDLAVMRHISHRIAVMYLGRIVELTDKRTLFTQPLHPYTEALLSAATAPDPKRRRQRKRIVQGDVPSPAKPPPGCHFHTRCLYATAECRVTDPPLLEVAPGHHVACLRRPVGGDPGPLSVP
jgi:oligopeptide transport system ATP-binding protein